MAGENNVNGNYGIQQQYGHADNNTIAASASNVSDARLAEPATSASVSGTAAGEAEEKPPTKDEIGWFFVEQYYKTLCNEPGKLYLYYNKRSQFVSGDEAERVQVAVGQKAISERIKQLDIQDCKVRVLNVDSQESLKNILVQVIGEMSNKTEPHRKFVQSFVLAEQPSGYYVLNDVFRYIILDEEEFENGAGGPDATATAANVEEGALAESETPVGRQNTVEQLDKKLEDITQEQAVADSDPSVANEDHEEAQIAPVIQAEDAPVAVTSATSVAAAEAAEEETISEKPRDPEPTPSIPSPAPAKAAPAHSEPAPESTKPSAPKTWANMVAANRAAVPAVPNGSVLNASTSTNPAKTKSTSSVKEEPSLPAGASDEAAAKPQQNGNAGWQMAGASSEKRQNRQQSQSQSPIPEGASAYVKNVTDKVDASILKERLLQHGKLRYFDVSRPRNCAFADFETAAGCQSAITANPYLIGGEQVIVEERRPRSNTFGGNFSNRGGVRGGRGGSENRSNNSARGNLGRDGGRGNYNNRGGRGGPIAARGRAGQPQPA